MNPSASPTPSTQLELFPTMSLDVGYDHISPPDLLHFVPHPYAKTRDIDVISKTYQCMIATKSSPAIAIFYLFGLTSFWCLKNEVTYQIPHDPRILSPNLWLIIMANSGASKTQQLSLLDALMPTEPEVHGTFAQPASAVSLVEQFRSRPEHLWVEDEAASYLKRIENLSDPLHQLKGHLLKAKGGDRITYHSKKDGEITVNSPKLSVVWVNTIAGMLSALSQESMIDGFFSRFCTVIAERTPELEKIIEENYPNRLHDLREIESSGLREDLQRIFAQDIRGRTYDFTGPGVLKTFEESSKLLEGQFAWMQGEENPFKPFFDRTILESFKYAVFHRLLRSKPGDLIDTFDMEFGMRVVKFHLCSITRFNAFKTGSAPFSAAPIKQDLSEKISAHILANPKCTIRDLCRVARRPKAEVLESLSRMGLITQVLSNQKRKKK